MVDYALELLNISCIFRAKDDRTQRYTAVADASLRVRAGEFVSVVGPTGCGKSTLLNVGAGLLEPSSGEVKVFGQPLKGINARAGYMFQSEALMPWRSAMDNVMLGLQYRGVADAKARDLAGEWLARVGLAGFGDRYPHQLSGGMRKRASLARTLVYNPPVVLMDEPFGALDAETRAQLQSDLLALWASEKKTILFVTHDINEAIALGDRIVVLSGTPGCIVLERQIDIARPRDPELIFKAPSFAGHYEAVRSCLRGAGHA